MLQHPVITQIERDGYPAWAMPESIYCEECWTCLDQEKAYEDEDHEYLCGKCLLWLHEKDW